MNWYDLEAISKDDPVGVVELALEAMPDGMALELQVFVVGDRTVGVWILETGQFLTWVDSPSA